ncbi:hypothetical protein BKA70DRAFT_1433936 [Coprinopsis sp. MPI-PUGE-AT-0042]|nr:hypothetical protein BKA70DRAFT_1433936 [Coprinopsis sp. MPI-PUGE-AT-0042]
MSRATRSKVAASTPSQVSDKTHVEGDIDPASVSPHTAKRKRSQATDPVSGEDEVQEISPSSTPSKKQRNVLPAKARSKGKKVTGPALVHDKDPHGSEVPLLPPLPVKSKKKRVDAPGRSDSSAGGGVQDTSAPPLTPSPKKGKEKEMIASGIDEVFDDAGDSGENDGRSSDSEDGIVSEADAVEDARSSKNTENIGSSGPSDGDPVLVPRYREEVVNNKTYLRIQPWALTGYGSAQGIDPETNEVTVTRVEIDNILEHYKDLKLDYLLSLITFVEGGELYNPARANPMDFAVRDGYSKQNSITKEIVHGETRKVVTFISFLASAGSELVSGKRPIWTNGLVYKYAAGYFTRGDGDRAEAFFPTVFNHQPLQAEFNEGGATFQTRNKPTVSSTESSPSKTSPGKGRLQLSNVPSRARFAPSNITSGFNFDSEVPVYDGRNTKIDLKTLLGHIGALPSWRGEIPDGTCMLVAYTAVCSQYSSNPWKVTFYIRFAVVIAA